MNMRSFLSLGINKLKNTEFLREQIRVDNTLVLASSVVVSGRC